VISSLWELDFDFAMNWMPIFLDNWLRKRQPKAIAYTQAMRTILTRQPDIEPHQWGTIVLLGDWL